MSSEVGPKITSTHPVSGATTLPPHKKGKTNSSKLSRLGVPIDLARINISIDVDEKVNKVATEGATAQNIPQFCEPGSIKVYNHLENKEIKPKEKVKNEWLIKLIIKIANFVIKTDRGNKIIRKFIENLDPDAKIEKIQDLLFLAPKIYVKGPPSTQAYTEALIKKEEFIGKNNVSRLQISTDQPNTTLDGLVIWNTKSENRAAFETLPDSKDQLKARQNSKWLFFMCGNAGCYENQLEMAKQYGEKMGCNVVMMNPRGVMDSQGETVDAQQMINDHERVLEHFIKGFGVPESQFVLWGHSLGGGVATDIATRHKGAFLINDRSFGSLASAAAGLVGRIENKVKQIIAYLRWTINSTQNWKQLEPNNVVLITAKRDETIKKGRRLHNELEKRKTESLQAEISSETQVINPRHIEFDGDHDEIYLADREKEEFESNKAVIQNLGSPNKEKINVLNKKNELLEAEIRAKELVLDRIQLYVNEHFQKNSEVEN